MITLDKVTKKYSTRTGTHTVLSSIDLQIKPGEKVGILGRNGAGKSTLIRLLSGVESPTSGSVKRSMSVSWPLAFSGAFQGSLTGMDNLNFICRVYGVDIKVKKAYIEDFAELGKYLYEPVKTYSSGMRARLAFAVSMAVEFDCYLIDEVIAVGDKRFQQKCREELFIKRKDRAIILVSHQERNIRQFCDRACVVSKSNLTDFENMDSAFDFYSQSELQK